MDAKGAGTRKGPSTPVRRPGRVEHHIAEVAEDWLADLKAGNRAPATLQLNGRAVGNLVDFLNRKGIRPTMEAVLSEVLRAYLVPFYAAARSELAERYAFTPGATHIEVFDQHRDFSVRSTGFEGFPALGVCFGPVVTAVSPVSELRGKFSWARTSFNERNRPPR